MSVYGESSLQHWQILIPQSISRAPFTARLPKPVFHVTDIKSSLTIGQGDRANFSFISPQVAVYGTEKPYHGIYTGKSAVPIAIQKQT